MSAAKLSDYLGISDVDLNNKRVLIRYISFILCLHIHVVCGSVDFNVPFATDGSISNTQRIEAALPTIRYALEHGARSVILMSHLGRPNGHITPKYSLKPAAKALEGFLNRPVQFLDDCVGKHVEKVCQDAKEGQVILLENLRFHVEEEGSRKDADGKKVSSLLFCYLFKRRCH